MRDFLNTLSVCAVFIILLVVKNHYTSVGQDKAKNILLANQYQVWNLSMATKTDIRCCYQATTYIFKAIKDKKEVEGIVCIEKTSCKDRIHENISKY